MMPRPVLSRRLSESGIAVVGWGAPLGRPVPSPWPSPAERVRARVRGYFCDSGGVVGVVTSVMGVVV